MKKIFISITIFGILCLAWIFYSESNHILTDGYIPGIYTEGFEVVSFSPDNSSERWWVTTNEEFRREYKRQVEEIGGLDTSGHDYHSVHVEIMANTSEKGSYGHVGAYERRAEITDFRNMRFIER